MNARLLVKTLRSVTLIPSAAVQHNGTAAFAYIVKPDKSVAVQQIKTLANDEQNTAVQGLNAGAEVATSGFDRLESGVKVQIRPAAQKNTKSSGPSSSGTDAP